MKLKYQQHETNDLSFVERKSYWVLNIRKTQTTFLTQTMFTWIMQERYEGIYSGRIVYRSFY